MQRRWWPVQASVVNRAVLAAGAAAAVVCVTGVASADEPVAPSEPRMMSETAEVSSVVDAFDGSDPFDLNITLGFEQAWKHSNIHRETSINQPGLSSGGFTATTENIASYTRATSKLDLGLDVGIYHDLALIVRLPIILSDTQGLGDLNGSSMYPQLLQDSTGQQLFKVPFSSPNRSGIDWFSVGLDWSIYNQQRSPSKPTWTIGVEGRFGVGTPLHACNANAAVECPNPSNPTQSLSPGISRAMDAVSAHTVFSRRFGYVEPYSGLWMLAEFPNGNSQSEYGATDSFQGSVVNHPPLVGNFSMGMEVIPWEHREQFQRFVADFRLSGIYHSAGRDYSELFDALGSSQASSLRSPNPGGYTQGPNNTSVADPTQQQVYFTGITDTQAFASVGAKVGATFQAGEYIKFTAGFGFTYDQSHLITASDACNPNFTSNPEQAGSCHTATSAGNTGTITGIPNPNFRPAIDLPGQRFSSDDGTIIELWISGIVMF